MLMKLYVGSISFDTSGHDQRNAFGARGTAESSTIIADRDTDRSRGFASVGMPSAEKGYAAITQPDGSQLDGLSLKVSEAKSQKDRAGSRPKFIW